MTTELFQMSLRHLATTVFDEGKLKPKYVLKNLINFIKIQNIHSKQIFIFFKNPEYSFKANIHFFEYPEYSFKTNIHFFKIQNIHSKKLFIFLKSRIFIQPKYSFF